MNTTPVSLVAVQRELNAMRKDYKANESRLLGKISNINNEVLHKTILDTLSLMSNFLDAKHGKIVSYGLINDYRYNDSYYAVSPVSSVKTVDKETIFDGNNNCLDPEFLAGFDPEFLAGMDLISNWLVQDQIASIFVDFSEGIESAKIVVKQIL